MLAITLEFLSAAASLPPAAPVRRAWNGPRTVAPLKQYYFIRARFSAYRMYDEGQYTWKPIIVFWSRGYRFDLNQSSMRCI